MVQSTYAAPRSRGRSRSSEEGSRGLRVRTSAARTAGGERGSVSRRGRVPRDVAAASAAFVMHSSMKRAFDWLCMIFFLCLALSVVGLAVLVWTATMMVHSREALSPGLRVQVVWACCAPLAYWYWPPLGRAFREGFRAPARRRRVASALRRQYSAPSAYAGG